jgi:predicted RNA methylase
LPPDADVIWLDFACGTCNLLMDVPDKSKCYVSTIDEGDVLIAKMNGFENCVQFDFLQKNDDDSISMRMPKFIYKGEEKDIIDIIKIENKPAVVVMNPPYEKKKYKQMLDKMVEKLKNFRIFYYTIYTLIEYNEIYDYKCKFIDGIYTSLKVFGLTNTPMSMLLLEFGKGVKSNIKSTLTLPVFDPVKEK